MNVITNHHKFIAKKNKKKLDKNKVFYCELLSIIVFHNYIEKVESLEKSSSLLSLIFKK
jgi:hypothetical protein